MASCRCGAPGPGSGRYPGPADSVKAIAGYYVFLFDSGRYWNGTERPYVPYIDEAFTVSRRSRSLWCSAGAG